MWGLSPGFATSQLMPWANHLACFASISLFIKLTLQCLLSCNIYSTLKEFRIFPGMNFTICFYIEIFLQVLYILDTTFLNFILTRNGPIFFFQNLIRFNKVQHFYIVLFFFLHCFDFPKLKGTHQKPRQRRLCTQGSQLRFLGFLLEI